MKKYTQDEFIDFEVVNGQRICPTGDYTEIKEFGNMFGVYCEFGDCCRFGNSCNFSDRCSFSDRCEFGSGCKFDYGCKFGDCKIGSNCEFGDYCKFDDHCKFGDDCKFSDDCKFGDYCTHGERCNIGNRCKLGHQCNLGRYCKFGACCVFGERCKYGAGCNYEDGLVVNGEFICFKNIGSENREVYLYINENKKLFLRAGCFFGDLENFEEHCDHKLVSTEIRDEYLCIFESAKNIFEVRSRSLIKKGRIL